METRVNELYEQWIKLYDEGDPTSAMQLAAPGLVMVTPDGRRLNHNEAVEFTKQIKVYVDGAGIRRATTIKALHTTRVSDKSWLLYATVDLLFTTPQGEESRHSFVEVMAIGPEGIFFDAFSKLADSQNIF